MSWHSICWTDCETQMSQEWNESNIMPNPNKRCKHNTSCFRHTNASRNKSRATEMTKRVRRGASTLSEVAITYSRTLVNVRNLDFLLEVYDQHRNVGKSQVCHVIPPFNKTNHRPMKLLPEIWQPKADFLDALLAHPRWHCNIARKRTAAKIKTKHEDNKWKTPVSILLKPTNDKHAV